MRKFWAQWPSLVWHSRQAAERMRVLETAFAIIGKRLIDAGVKAIEESVGGGL